MSRPVCARCARPRSHCLCALIPALSCRTRVLFLQHPAEARHALNTARLAALGLRQAELHVGERFDPALWRRPGMRSWLLFPGEAAREPGPVGEGGPLLLVVPDGSWRQARGLVAGNPDLASLPRLALPADGVSAYRVRHADLPGALSTIEAVVQVLNALEAPARFDALLAPFHALVQGQVRAMGDEVYQRHHVRRAGRRGKSG
ncbi:tRNA-uridine aminocarboxypropyltransferase [Bordetella bronchiseptica]|uniref:tRNA-uridine aminocarboxypropyltransferase n=1 Tax=Bordetella bronchiseptica (strain ATCC BAA-588 / NCTC 13252 / RB50) TaxID=257310 RepID=A0A0H3LU65_BORBR|nr:DTW domain-containing protein [Bordetella bronchiseptica]KAK67986.1 DTW domain protein [Bordetella bronchiseptica 980-2]KDD55595.1 DTW domain protein [Bordetella bronchiseptica OSU553]AMG88314.1 DTW domain-containing protein [Bordetella bronchiseptica]AWP80715.1 DTW domain-containing protein [Bordetella bronchiseptica]AWP85509.1 DTW domain-containing protein [Bordetella bronchiseptica]